LLKEFEKIKDKLIVFFNQKNFLGAEKFIRSFSPNYENNHILLVYLGLSVTYQQRFDEAEDIFKKAIKINKNYADAYFNLAKICEIKKNYADASLNYRKTIKIDPEYLNAYLNLAQLLVLEKQINKAISILKDGIKNIHSSSELYNNLGQIYFSRHDYDEAEKNYVIAIKYQPDNVKILNNLISNFLKKKLYFDAKLLIDKALLLDSNNEITRYHLGFFFQKTSQYFEAIKVYEKLLSENSTFPLVYGCLGLCYYEVRKFDDAISFFKQSEKIYKQTNDLVSLYDSYLNLGYSGLIDYKFKSHSKFYEYRWIVGKGIKKKYDYPNWDGSYCQNLVVWGEQGVGDHIFYGALVDKLIKLAKNIILEVDKRLIKLFQDYFSYKKIYNIKVLDINNNFEVHNEKKKFIPIASLPSLLLSDNLDDWNISSPFLFSENNKNQNFVSNSSNLKIGISWKSFNLDEQHRSINFADFINVFKDLNCSIYNLQFGNIDDELNFLKEKKISFSFDSSIDYKNDLNSVSALIKNLDLIVTAQNTVAHLSCALGKKTLVLLPLNGRWMYGRQPSTCKWYPSARLIRSKNINSWSDVLNKLRLILKTEYCI